MTLRTSTPNLNGATPRWRPFSMAATTSCSTLRPRARPWCGRITSGSRDSAPLGAAPPVEAVLGGVDHQSRKAANPSLAAACSAGVADRDANRGGSPAQVDRYRRRRSARSPGDAGAVSSRSLQAQCAATAARHRGLHAWAAARRVSGSSRPDRSGAGGSTDPGTSPPGTGSRANASRMKTSTWRVCGRSILTAHDGCLPRRTTSVTSRTPSSTHDECDARGPSPRGCRP